MYGAVDPTAATAYWEQFKLNWIEHNKPMLNQDYQEWINQHLQYNLYL